MTHSSRRTENDGVGRERRALGHWGRDLILASLHPALQQPRHLREPWSIVVQNSSRPGAAARAWSQLPLHSYTHLLWAIALTLTDRSMAVLSNGDNNKLVEPLITWIFEISSGSSHVLPAPKSGEPGRSDNGTKFKCHLTEYRDYFVTQPGVQSFKLVLIGRVGLSGRIEYARRRLTPMLARC